MTKQTSIKNAKKTYGKRIKWNGGSCPALPNTKVEVKLSGGVIETGFARDFYWGHYNDEADIIEYRVVTG